MILINWNKSLFAIGMGMIGALIITLFVQLMAPKPTIATVNLTGIINGFIQSQTKQHISADELKGNMKVFSESLNQVLHTIARKKHVVLVPEQAVIAGSPDLTSLVMERLKTKDPQFFESIGNNRQGHA